MDPSQTPQYRLSQICLSQTRLSQTRLSEPSSSPPLIPGPAGVVQAAMRQKILDRQAPSSSREAAIPTQQYIQRAIEDSVEDQDFKKRNWLSAMEFLTEEGTYYLLSYINIMYLEKVDQVVAIVKSCRPNDLGDLMITLKDPTATIETSIHWKVLTVNPFGMDITVGYVLILHKVAVFAKSRSSGRVLNITLSNLYMVFRKR